MNRKQTVFGVCAAVLVAASVYKMAASPAAEPTLSPAALAVSRDGKSLFIACATARQVVVFNVASRRITSKIAVPDEPTGLTLSNDGARLFVTCSAPESRVGVIDVAKGKVIETSPAGHSAMSPVLSPDGKTLFVCNRFNNDVSFIDVAAKKEVRRVKVQREPVSAALTKDGRFLLVANHLHNGRADVDFVAAVVSVIDVNAGKVVKELQLPNGSSSLQNIRISPDGKYAAVTHLIGHHQAPTSQLERGWINTNAATIIDIRKMGIVNSVLLDGVSKGAANPWGVAWTNDGSKLLATHAGTHELSVTDFPALLAKLALLPVKLEGVKTVNYVAGSSTQEDVPTDLSFLGNVRQMLKLPKLDRGPRAVAVVGSTAYTANYYSDTLSVFDLAVPANNPESIALGAKQEANAIRRGEAYFHDASLCFQGWQSCASCHPGNARTDGMNWDLLNDGVGNPKNVKSMLLSHRTPPAMSLGVRETAETAVRSGIKHIQFSEQPAHVPAAIDEYLKALKPIPSPYLVKGQLSAAALRGREIYNSKAVGCAVCHPAGMLTDLKEYEVGTAGRFDGGFEKWDTPTLVEIWRTAPYLHDGSAATMRDVLTGKNPKDKHGKTSQLTPQQIKDLEEYVLSL